MNTALIVLIAANILFSYKGFQDISFFRKYEFHVGSIRAGEQFRMFTSAFLHADVVHLAFNMLTLYFFAPAIVGWFDTVSFVVIYFGSLVFGSLLTLYFHRHDYSYRAIGASGAVTGIVYAAILLNPDSNIYIFYAIPMPAYLFGIVYLLYSIYGMKSKRDNIGHAAHFGGAVGGYVITLGKMPSLFTDQPFVVILLAVPILIMFVMARLGKL
jgi:membrane associated rhomboid family serine protease